MHLSLPERFPLCLLASSVCKSVRCLISTLTQAGKGGHLFRFTCSVVLQRGRNTANKYHWHVFTVIQPHWVCPCLWRVCFPSLHCSGCSAGNCLMRALVCMHFPGLSHSGSGSQVLHKGTDSVGYEFCALPGSKQLRWPGTWPAHSPWVGHCILSPPRSQPLGFPGAKWERCFRCAMCLLWGADFWLQPSWWTSTVQDPRKTWLATGSLLTVGRRCHFWG